MRLHVLGSGSKGNAAIVESVSSGIGVLIDCGICKRDFVNHAAEVGFDLGNLRAILITHDHTDHTKGLGVVLRGLAKQGIRPELYVDQRVLDASSQIREILGLVELRFMEPGHRIKVEDLSIMPFSTSHDAASSCGFRFVGDGEALGYLTDSGFVTPEAHEGLSGCRILALESNHDLAMLHSGPYPEYLKARVGSDVGHLSNEQSAAELKSLLWPGLEHVVAMHVSENNNTYGIPVRTLQAVLDQAGHPAQVHVAYQKRCVSVG